jgi:hypothetical protein
VQVLQILKVSLHSYSYRSTWLMENQWLFVEEVVDYTVHWVIKSAFLFFYLRLSPKKSFRMFVWVGMGLNGMIWVVNVYGCSTFLLHQYQTNNTNTGSWHVSNACLSMKSSILARIRVRYASTDLPF